MLNWLFFMTFMVSLMLTLLGLLIDVTLQIQYLPQLQALQSRQQQQVKTYYGLHAQFADKPLFNPKPSSHSPLKISKYIPDNQSRLVDIPSKYAILSLGPRWMEKRHKLPENPKVESFMAAISQHSNWPLEEKEIEELDLSPSDFIVVAQFHLAQAYYSNDGAVIPALQNVRQLAQLLLSTNFMNFKRAGLSILEKEHDFIEFIRARKNAAEINWNLIAQNDIQNYIKLLNLTETYMSAFNTPETLQKIFLGKNLPIGFCALFHKKYGAIEWELAFLSPQAPFEQNFKEATALLSDIKKLGISKCRLLSFPRKLVKLPWVHKVPYYRRLFALHAALGNGPQLLWKPHE